MKEVAKIEDQIIDLDTFKSLGQTSVEEEE